MNVTHQDIINNSINTFVSEINNPEITSVMRDPLMIDTFNSNIKWSLLDCLSNLGQNTTLKSITIKNSILDITTITVLMMGLSKNITITKLYIYNSGLRYESAYAISIGLMQNIALTYLNLNENNIGSDGASVIGRVLKFNSTLQSLKLAGNNIDSNGIIDICISLQSNSTLITLDLGSNQINSNGASIISNALKINSTLKTLYLDHNNLDSDGARHIAIGLYHNSSLIKLNLCNTNIEARGIVFIGKALEQNSTLQILNITNNTVNNTVNNTESFFKSLTHNTTLKILYYMNNQINGNILDHLIHINLLKLYINNIGANSIEPEYIAEKLIGANSKLKLLDISDNHLSYRNIINIGRCLKHNTTLTSLILDRNNINIDGINIICSVLRNNILTHLSLQSNIITTRGGTNIISALHNNTSLTSLDLSNNHIGLDGSLDFTIALNATLQVNTILNSLFINSNCLNNTAMTMIAVALQTNTTLRKLEIFGNQIEIETDHTINDLLDRNVELYDNDFVIKSPLSDKARDIIISVLLLNNSEDRLLPRLPNYVFFEILQFWQNKHF